MNAAVLALFDVTASGQPEATVPCLWHPIAYWVPGVTGLGDRGNVQHHIPFDTATAPGLERAA